MDNIEFRAETAGGTSGSGLARRSFLKSCGGFAGWLAPGGAVLTLVSCGGGDADRPVPVGEAVPFDNFKVLDQPASASLSVQERQVQWVVGKNPTQTNAWVYVSDATPSSGVLATHLGPTFDMRRDKPCTVTWSNTVPASSTEPTRLASPPIHVPLDLGQCGRVRTQSPVGFAVHLHGARVQAAADGWPLTPIGFAANPYGFPTSRQDLYPNAQRAAMLWYHDHAMDRVGRHVHAGLVGAYCIRDAADDAILAVVGGKAHELLCVINDRVLSADGTRIDYEAGIPHDPSLSKIGSDDAVGRPEFLGTAVFVNGHPAPDLALTRSAWRLRLLNASNARTYAIALCDPDAIAARTGRVWYSSCIRLIGADGGLIGVSVPLQDGDALVIAPAQRRDIVVDLGSIPPTVSRLRLVNLSLRYLLAVDSLTLEAIYTTFEASVLTPTSTESSAADQALYVALDGPLAVIARIAVGAPSGAAAAPPVPPPVPTAAAIDRVLVAAADEDDFVWNGTRMVAPPGTSLGQNRFVLLVSNTRRLELRTPVNGVDGWGDVQIFELAAGGSDWQLPFTLDLATAADPPAGEPSAVAQGYRLARKSFFAQELNADIVLAKAYPPLHAPTINARAGTWERWYVANLNNSQPLDAGAGAPDMHPFHIHLVNFVVERRWQLDDSGSFTPVPPSDLALDRIARQDTVAIPSNQVVELLVHYPAGYSGDFAYHCHILEHEDMCMMLHYHLDA